MAGRGKAFRRLLAAGVATAALASVPSALGTATTTDPGILYKVKITITDKKIRIPEVRYPRGAIIQYHIRNRGKKRHAFDIGHIRTRPIKPGGKTILLVTFTNRGRFHYSSPLKADRKVDGLHGRITVY